MKSPLMRVVCNEGFKSEPMHKLSAKRYAKRLEQLGNYDVRVVRAE